jgi:hypothetical protein
VHGNHRLQVDLTGNEIVFLRNGGKEGSFKLEGADNRGGSLMIKIRLDAGTSTEGYVDNLKILYASDAGAAAPQ